MSLEVYYLKLWNGRPLYYSIYMFSLIFFECLTCCNLRVRYQLTHTLIIWSRLLFFFFFFLSFLRKFKIIENEWYYYIQLIFYCILTLIKQNSLKKSLEEVNASSLANIEKGRVMFYEFGVGLSKAYLRLPQALRWSALQQHLIAFSR